MSSRPAWFTKSDILHRETLSQISQPNKQTKKIKKETEKIFLRYVQFKYILKGSIISELPEEIKG